jgi:hypothetical protein
MLGMGKNSAPIQAPVLDSYLMKTWSSFPSCRSSISKEQSSTIFFLLYLVSKLFLSRKHHNPNSFKLLLGFSLFANQGTDREEKSVPHPHPEVSMESILHYHHTQLVRGIPRETRLRRKSKR